MDDKEKAGIGQIGFMQGTVIVYSFSGVFQKLASRYPEDFHSVSAVLWMLYRNFICICSFMADDFAQGPADKRRIAIVLCP